MIHYFCTLNSIEYFFLFVWVIVKKLTNEFRFYNFGTRSFSTCSWGSIRCIELGSLFQIFFISVWLLLQYLYSCIFWIIYIYLYLMFLFAIKTYISYKVIIIGILMLHRLQIDLFFSTKGKVSNILLILGWNIGRLFKVKFNELFTLDLILWVNLLHLNFWKVNNFVLIDCLNLSISSGVIIAISLA
jgi:hypothetical protein